MNHNLKTWPQYFHRICANEKRFELRKNDRDFQVGDVLTLEEFNPDTNQYSNNKIDVKVVYILHGPAFGIQDGYCVMSIDNMYMH